MLDYYDLCGYLLVLFLIRLEYIIFIIFSYCQEIIFELDSIAFLVYVPIKQAIIFYSFQRFQYLRKVWFRALKWMFAFLKRKQNFVWKNLWVGRFYFFYDQWRRNVVHYTSMQKIYFFERGLQVKINQTLLQYYKQMIKVCVQLNTLILKIKQQVLIECKIKKQNNVSIRFPQKAKLINYEASFKQSFQFFMKQADKKFSICIIGIQGEQKRYLGSVEIELKQLKANRKSILQKNIKQCLLNKGLLKLSIQYTILPQYIQQSLLPSKFQPKQYQQKIMELIANNQQIKGKFEQLKSQNNRIKSQNKSQIQNLNKELEIAKLKNEKLEKQSQEKSNIIEALNIQLAKQKKRIVQLIDLLNQRGEISILDKVITND